MPKTYEPIATTTLNTTASSVVFSTINQNYTDLIIVLEAKTSALVDTCMRFNADTGTNYSHTRLIGNGSAASSDRNSNISRILMGDSDTGASILNIIQIQNYSNTTTNKTAIIRSNKADRILFAIAALWRNTAAITSVTLFPDSGTWSSGSTFTLYGIKSA